MLKFFVDLLFTPSIEQREDFNKWKKRGIR